ncbi:MAG: hypothetical protein LBD40_03620 [Puniceicoccales bacterium]|jgi:hypothetical protein|nr:hypothetical protein [Puniceicoccales bacterium]
MSDFWQPLSSSSAESIQGASSSSEEPKVEENPVTSLAEILQQFHEEIPLSTVSEAAEKILDLGPEVAEGVIRTIDQMEQEGVFSDVDGDGVPDYNDITGTESRFSKEEREGIFSDVDGDGVADYNDVTGTDSRFKQEASKGTTGAMDAVRAMMGSILGLNFSPIRPVELESELGKIQGTNLQTTMAATHKNRITTHFDVGVPMRSETAQKRRNLFRVANTLKMLNHMKNFYGGSPKVSDRSRVGDDMSRPR